MIVLTGCKAAPFYYCLTTAQYCPLPGQYLAIARHKTIRQEIEKPYSQFYPSPYHEVQSSLGHPTLADMIVVGVKNKMKEARCRDIFEEVREHCGDLLLTDITDV